MQQQTRPVVEEKIVNGVLHLEFNAPHRHNPFSAEMEIAVARRLQVAEANDQVRALVVSGGKERSFSVGGDFNEVKEFEGGPEVDRWIDDIVNMYVACLAVQKPTVAALDNYVIGIGFQLALCCDYRIGSTRCQLVMPELKNGIACVLGQYMLEKMLGRAQMLKIVVDCEQVDLQDALRLGLVNDVCSPEELRQQAQSVAESLADYPAVAYRVTKQEFNQSFIRGLREVTPVAQTAHRAAFKDRSAQRFMNGILKK